jgi:hypothetical protein
VTYGAPVTSLKDYTPVWTSSGTAPSIGNGSITGKYSQVGDMLKGQITVTTGSTTSFGSGDYYFSIPSGLSMDVNKVPRGAFGDESYVKGGFYSLLYGVNRFSGMLVAQTATSLGAKISSTPSAANPTPVATNGALGATYPGTWSGAGNIWTLTFEVPILGWSSSTVVSSEADTRVVSASAYLGSNQALTSGAGAQIQINTIISDSHAAFATASYQYVIQSPGYYDFLGGVEFASNANGIRYVSIKKGSSYIRTATFVPISGDNFDALVSAKSVWCKAGEIIQLWATHTSGGNLNALGNSNTFLAVSKQSGPAQISASEVVIAKASGNPASASANNPIIFPTVEFDTHGSYNASTGRYTCATPGFFEVSGFMVGATDVSINLYKDGSSNTRIATTGSSASPVTFSTTVQCIAGTILDIRPDGTFDASVGNITFKRIGGIG